ncbi:hypothetical protein NOK06_13455 [Neorhizobium galegae]|nr:hypothetical protein [Neorhizobium galegae]
MKLENIFCDINTNRRNLFHGGWLLSKVLQQPILAHSMPSEGAIHHINLTQCGCRCRAAAYARRAADFLHGLQSVPHTKEGAAA